MDTQTASSNTITGTIPQNTTRYPGRSTSNTSSRTSKAEYTWEIDQELIIEPDSVFTISGEKKVTVSVPPTYRSKMNCFKAGSRLWALVQHTTPGKAELIQVMDAFRYNALQSRCRRDNTEHLLSKLWDCPLPVREEILRRRPSPRTDEEDIRSPEITSEFYSMAFALMEDSYTTEQQDRIRTLFGRGVGSKCALQLNYILNISEEFSGRQFEKYDKIMEVFDKRIYGRAEQKHRIAELLSSRTFSKSRGVKIMLTGPEGVGKTLFREAIREAIHLPDAVIELGGESNPAALGGFSATYVDADAGEILKTFRKTRTTEAIIEWVDIDKMNSSREGVAIDALKSIFADDRFVDKFTLYPLSTRHTVHVVEVTSTQNLPESILSECEVIQLDGYTEDEKVLIARDYLIPKLMQKTWAHMFSKLGAPEDDVLRVIARNFCGDDGMRQMEEHCAAVLKHIVRQGLTNHAASLNANLIPFDAETVRAVLGDEPDRNNPMIRFNLSRDRFAPEIIDAVAEIRERLKDLNLKPEERVVEEQRLNYFVDLAEPVPSTEPFDRECFLNAVNATHYGIDSVKELLADYLAAQAALGGSFGGMRLLLEGPAGVGKTSIIESFAKAISAAYVRIPLNNITEPSTLKGVYKTFANADAGMIVKKIAGAKRDFPDKSILVVHLDEVDKLSAQLNDILVDLLDDSGLFLDYFLGLPINLSYVVFCGTANDVSRIPDVILNRFRVIHMNGYRKDEKQHILQNYLLPAKNRLYAASDIQFRMEPQTEALLLDGYDGSEGVRDLKRAIDRLTEHAISHGTRDADGQLILSPALVREALGDVPMEHGNLPTRWQAGCVKALSVSGGGAGGCFAIETLAFPEETGLTITGLAGESAADSVQIARTYLKSKYPCAKGPWNIHLSFGEGAIRKDGPSAGVAVLISILSAMRGEPSDPAVAYTGEIDLFGNIYPVGGVLAKLRAAERAGCKRVFLPAENAKRLTEEERTSLSLDIVPVMHVEEVIHSVFAAPLAEKKRIGARQMGI